MKIGIKVASASAESGGIIGLRKIELYCVETGESIEGVVDVHLNYSVLDVIRATVNFIPQEIKGTDEVLYPKAPPLRSKETS